MRKANSPSLALKITLKPQAQTLANQIAFYSAMTSKTATTTKVHYLDWVSPDLTRSWRMWNLLLPHQSDQLM